MRAMNAFYEEDGGFKAGTVLSDQGGALHVEAVSGKRVKVKANHVLIQFQEPDPAGLMRAAELLAADMDIDFLWECAPQDEFDFATLGAEYFGHPPSPVEGAALILRLHGAPMYFYRKGRGRYRPAPPEILQAAQAGQKRRAEQAARQAQWAAELQSGQLPESLAGRVAELLFKPDKNGIEYKALDAACSAMGISPARLMLAVGGLPSARVLHMQRFLALNFPRGTHFPEVIVPPAPPDLPEANVEAFSIDDSATTEIDDAFSVTAINDATRKLWRIGIHIAAPAAAMKPDDAIDNLARERLSTVYVPGEKITMLPDAMVDGYTLAAGRACLALSLYVDVDAEDWRIVSSESRVEWVPIAHNLRHDALEDLITEVTLASQSGDYPCKAEFAVLWPFAQSLYEGRQAARIAAGLRRETENRPDYSFHIEGGEGPVGPEGKEVITIAQRKRGSPLDRIVAELMILANSTWGKLLAEHGVPGIYRSQQGFGPAGRVRMSTHPSPHQGLGVAQYAWSTSPLRRYVDMVNQWQLLACIQEQPAPFPKNDMRLFAIIAAFDAAYAAYSEIQSTMERYWCLRWLQQRFIEGAPWLIEALVQRDDVVRLAEVPLVFRVPGLPSLPRGNRVELEIKGVDLVDLTVDCRVVAIIEEVDSLDASDEEDDVALYDVVPTDGLPTADALTQGDPVGLAEVAIETPSVELPEAAVLPRAELKLPADAPSA